MHLPGGLIKMKKNLLILGAGQLGEVTQEIAEAAGDYEMIRFLDDANPAAIGKLNDYSVFADSFQDAIVAVDDLKIRIEYYEKLKAAGFNLAKIIHPTAFLSPSCSIGEGTIIEPMAFIHTKSVIGNGCIVAECAVIGHHTHIDDFCYIASHATVMQNTYMKPCTSTITGQLFFAEPSKRTVPGAQSNYSFDSGF
jgi:UDP-N-acetylbacillosamine N-acetyltransferase